jgi:hypothetical protein
MNDVWQSFDWEELLLCLTDGRVIPVIGRELLMVEVDGHAVSLDRYLADRVAASLGIPESSLPPDFDLNDLSLAQDKRQGGRRKLYSRIKAVMDGRPLQAPDALRKLARITDFNLYVTLTFDSLLSMAIDQERFDGQSQTLVFAYSNNREVQDLPCDVSQLDRPCVYHLYGRLTSATDYAVTAEDVLEFTHTLQSAARRPALLFDEFRNNHLLFIGCGFPDWLERFLVRTVTNERLLVQRGTSGFMCDDVARGDRRLRDFLRHFRTEVFEKDDALSFVDALYERWQERVPIRTAPSTSQRSAPSAAIFISYASENLDVARLIRDALDDSGLDVWFDKGALATGDAWDQKIRANIRHCAYFVPIISHQARVRVEGYFRREWTWAINRDEAMDESRRFIQPLVIDHTPDGADRIPDHFWSRQHRRLPKAPSAEFDGALRLFVEELQQAVRAHRLRNAGYE